MSNKPTWPADEPWWQFTPRNLATGYLTLGAAALLLIWSGIELLGGGLERNQTILFVIIAVCGLALLFQSTTGLKKLLRRRNQR
ncbi:hypothetical protein AB0L70_34610 [Kribbella sp. NPDC051952]|uniref:hypothetical protein n=1 Tax=Kribbella sp. NPDC051952 TaxID=3154851 RepID=UPI00343E4FB7